MISINLSKLEILWCVQVVDLLLSYGADVTLENDCRESVLDVAGDKLRSHILSKSTCAGG